MKSTALMPSPTTSKPNLDSIRERDIRHLWHPYTDITSFERQDAYTLIERAEGVTLYEAGGRPLLDGISSWWCVNLGHGHPRLVEAIQRQAERLQHCILGGISHPGAVELAERLARLTPGDLNHAFFCGDGASACEAALKIALQYWVNVGETERTEFICLADGYHGDTLGAMSVGFVEAFHKPFAGVVKPAHRAPSPHCNRCPFGKQPETCAIECFDPMEQLIREHHRRTAAVIVEPLCQGAAGVRIYPDPYLRKLRRLCDEYGLLLICDEIAVGFGRTGSMFASERAAIAPDIMTLGKGLTGGYLPMSAAMVTSRIHDSFRRRDGQARTFFHGHTFCGNPITSACALAALDVYEEDRIIERLPPRIAQLREGMTAPAATLDGAKVRTLGMIGALELSEQSGGAARAQEIARQANQLGLFIRPLGASVYLWPPLVVSEEELVQMLSILKQAVFKTR